MKREVAVMAGVPDGMLVALGILSEVAKTTREYKIKTTDDDAKTYGISLLRVLDVFTLNLHGQLNDFRDAFVQEHGDDAVRQLAKYSQYWEAIEKKEGALHDQLQWMDGKTKELLESGKYILNQKLESGEMAKEDLPDEVQDMLKEDKEEKL